MPFNTKTFQPAGLTKAFEPPGLTKTIDSVKRDEELSGSDMKTEKEVLEAICWFMCKQNSWNTTSICKKKCGVTSSY